MGLIDSLDTARQVYLNLLHRYLQGHIYSSDFHNTLRARWSEEREGLWQAAWAASSAARCLEIDALAAGERPAAAPTDPRRLPRMLDRLWMVQYRHDEEDAFREAARDLLRAYHNPDHDSAEAAYIRYPPHIHLYERPLPASGNHRYPCTLAEIRAQLAAVPEYDMEGLWAIGLELPLREDADAYGLYDRWRLRGRRPVIALNAYRAPWETRYSRRCNPGWVVKACRVEFQYGMQIDRHGCGCVFRWPEECLKRYMLEHTLLHEIGHHVQYQERWRKGYRRWLPSRQKEQFAEDYAIRANRMKGTWSGGQSSIRGM